MPLRAIIDGQEVIAPLLDDAAWDALRRRVADENLRVALPCCDVEGYLRQNQHGTKHFAHKQNADCRLNKGETVEHLRAKAEIVVACHASGYDASTEVAGADWRADVLATRGSARIAFEVQWSFLRLRDVLYRQRRYANDGVRGCWFFRRPPTPLQRLEADLGPDLDARRELPLFHLFAAVDGSYAIALHRRLHRLPDFVGALLGGRVRFCERARVDGVQRLRAVFFELDCARCGQRSHLYVVDTTQTAACGVRFRPESDWYSDEFAFHPALLAALERYRRTETGARLRLGAIKVRDDGSESYRSFGCAHCDAIFDRRQVALALSGGRRFWDDPAAESFEVDVPLHLSGAMPHWCYPADGHFCGGD